MKETFWKSVYDLIGSCYRTYWFDGLLPYLEQDAELDFDIGLQHAREFILNRVQNRGMYFKIGITSHPLNRWTRADCGYAFYGRDEFQFNHMKILWVSEFSHKRFHDGTGRMEIELIKLYNESTHPFCINRDGAGGESPPRGTPQFCYVVFG
jgi:hypothetical protein